MKQNFGVNKNRDYLKSLISILPDMPGIYQYFDNAGKIIYIGKAKNLKKRVSSYFTKVQENRKTALLVRNIADIKHMIVETEEDALLLENNLIKKYKPRYNVLLKDDKTYPWIVVKDERFPRVFQTRNIVRDGSAYFGPYTSVLTVRTLLGLFRKLYKLRTCNFNLSEENVKNRKYKICLEYHIGNCLGPCEGKIDTDFYNQNIDQIRDILKGNISGVIKYLKELMKQFADEYKFEEANEIKEKLISLEKFQSRSTVVSSTITDVDIFSIDEDKNFGFVNYLKVIKGAIVQTYTMEIKKSLDESKQELLEYAIVDIRQKIFSNAKEILVPMGLDISLENVKFRVPQKGDKKKLLELSERNAKYYRLEKEKQTVISRSQKSTERILETLKKDLHLNEFPTHIECFDNSNLQGTNPVAACVVFRNTKPSKKEYRHFNVKSVEGPNDFASMEEIVFRRYRRLIDEQKSLPQLIVIDGGKGQLGAALSALEKLELRGKITIIGIAKRLEEIYFPGDSVPLYLDKNSESLKVIQQLRDEAHRFGISFHRDKRSKEFIKSELETIKGVGKVTIELLLKKFKSVENLKKQSFRAVADEIGDSRALIIFDYFKLSNSKSNQ
ncbi:MAG: excinuclease ABC subunit C [Bacteroidetes bacterium GWF2_42_66]|nr:MAG: excinuclease ABC subunit C [Bacteroidetes bacterium GWA2_42_15]OFX97958.1 MAG: excinuclease ABC subunit C [Bacteroidetes bacterium GWE2_42_39]OFY45805.1 MAG: excinuclease ABC subunit C [Bacteroidetes bacterium GWF2_42_66]HBL74695.1 excinuclease ABC subunit C [Prolixibacteraceae bacterium]HCR89430.1 excinuclease ABC subunit C [Prolixibacteraceae bacterium]